MYENALTSTHSSRIMSGNKAWLVKRKTHKTTNKNTDSNSQIFLIKNNFAIFFQSAFENLVKPNKILKRFILPYEIIKMLFFIVYTYIPMPIYTYTLQYILHSCKRIEDIIQYL